MKHIKVNRCKACPFFNVDISGEHFTHECLLMEYFGVDHVLHEGGIGGRSKSFDLNTIHERCPLKKNEIKITTI